MLIWHACRPPAGLKLWNRGFRWLQFLGGDIFVKKLLWDCRMLYWAASKTQQSIRHSHPWFVLFSSWYKFAGNAAKYFILFQFCLALDRSRQFLAKRLITLTALNQYVCLQKGRPPSALPLHSRTCGHGKFSGHCCGYRCTSPSSPLVGKFTFIRKLNLSLALPFIPSLIPRWLYSVDGRLRSSN